MPVTLGDQRVNFVKLLLMHVRKLSFIKRMTFKNICPEQKTEESLL